MRQQQTNTNDRSILAIAGSIGLGVLASFVITIILGIQLSDYAKILISLLPPILSSIWAIRAKRIRAARLWCAIGHGVTYGIINFIFNEVFMAGIESLASS